MSEHQLPDHDPRLSALYRHASGEEPSARLDAQILMQVRHQAARHRQRRWLPLASAAVVVLAMGLLLRHQQRPDELQPQLALELPQEAQPKAAAPVVALPAAPLRRDEAAARQDEGREVGGAESRAKAKGELAAPAQMMEQAVEREAPVVAAPSPAPASTGWVASEPAPAAPLDRAAEAKRAASAPPAPAASMERSLADEAPPAPAGAMSQSVPQREAGLEPPAAWLKRIEALRARGDLDAARRELTAFRKVYPAWPLPTELLPLLPPALPQEGK